MQQFPILSAQKGPAESRARPQDSLESAFSHGRHHIRGPAARGLLDAANYLRVWAKGWESAAQHCRIVERIASDPRIPRDHRRVAEARDIAKRLIN